VGEKMVDPITMDNQTPIHRRSIRLKEYDYSTPGAYFVTVVTHGYKCIFGKIINKEMHMNDLGMIVQDCWINIPEHFINVEIEPYVIMPNHIHGIITIRENDRRGTIILKDKSPFGCLISCPYNRKIRTTGCWILTNDYAYI
jgi:hypothetical protein